MKVGICDDISADRLMVREWILSNRPEIKDADMIEFPCGESLLQYLEKNTLDILFLDGRMDGLNGIQTSAKIKEHNIEILIIILSDYINYAIDGYGVNVFNFILKKDFERRMPIVFDNAVKFAGEKVCRTYTVKLAKGLLHIRIKDILYVESKLHKLKITLGNGNTHEYYGKLDSVENDLRQHGFIRIHKSFLVNCFYIKHFESNVVMLDNGISLAISRKRYKQAMDSFTLYAAGVTL